MLKCRNCGAPYAGGIICEKCGTKYTDRELRENAAEEAKRKNSEMRSRNTAHRNNTGSSGKNISTLVVVTVVIISVVVVLSIATAVLIPVYIGYNAKNQVDVMQKEAMDRQSSIIEDFYDNASDMEDIYDDISDRIAEQEEKIRGVDKIEYMKEHGVYKSGTYECGTDIPEGEYIVVSDGEGYEDFYMGVYTQSDCSEDSRLYADFYAGNVYVRLSEGQFIDFSNATLYDMELNDITVAQRKYGAMYKVGKDIEPGVYRIVPTTEDYGCEYTIYSSLDSIIPVVKENNYFDFSDSEPVTVELSEGEYIRLRFAGLEKE
ncbi:MAG: hypothetical protein E7505_07540 [Ruminococcus sp.]|nr:hypothetical protein [Ruminococcus sp.]